MGCASSAPAEDTRNKNAKKPGPSAAAPAARGPSVSQAQTSQASKPAAEPAKPTASKVTLLTDRTDDDELHEIDRLLQGTKSELRMRPLELSDEPSPTKSPAAARGMDAQSPARSDGPGTPPQGAGLAAKQPSLQPLRPAGLPGTLSPGPTSPGLDPQQQQQQQQQQAAAHSDDPWASLQSAYRIDPNQAGGAASPTPAHRGGPAAPLAGKPAGRGAAGGSGADAILVLDDGDDDGGGGGGYGAPSSQPLYARQAQVPAHLSTKPKQGGWGAGAMAQAGTLMVGDAEQEMVRLAPPGAPEAPPSPTLDANEFEKIKQRIKANQAVADLGVEDIEDVDDLLEQEAKGNGLSGGLAAKLAAFEALNADDD